MHLDACRLGHGADLAQVVVGQGELQVQMHHAVDVMVRRGALVNFGECGIRRRGVDGMDEIRGKNLVERGAVQEVVGFQSQRQADLGLGDVAFQLGQREVVGQARQVCDRLDQPAPQQGGQVGIGLEQALLGIARIAAEYFIAAVAGQHVLESCFARSLGAEIGRHGRVVAERLVVFTRDDGNRGHDVGGLQVILVGAAAVAFDGAARVFHLVETRRRRSRWKRCRPVRRARQ